MFNVMGGLLNDKQPEVISIYRVEITGSFLVAQTSLFSECSLSPSLVEIGVLSQPITHRAVQRDLLPLTEELQPLQCCSQEKRDMQTQSMTVTVTYDDILDFIPSVQNQLRGWDWS